MDAFTAGPGGGDEQEVHCMICKHDVSVRGKGACELLSHSASKSQFLRYQRFRITDDGVVSRIWAIAVRNWTPIRVLKLCIVHQLLEDPDIQSCGIAEKTTKVSLVVF